MSIAEYLRKCVVPLVAHTDGSIIGTAFFVSLQGHLVTCHHVARQAAAIRWQDQSRTFSVVKQDHATDFAVLKTDVSPPLCLALGEAYEHREEVTSIGYSEVERFYGVPITGTIEGAVTDLVKGSLIRFKGSDILPGMSGSPLFNENRERLTVVGIISEKRDDKWTGLAVEMKTVLNEYPPLLDLNRASMSKVYRDYRHLRPNKGTIEIFVTEYESNLDEWTVFGRPARSYFEECTRRSGTYLLPIAWAHNEKEEVNFRPAHRVMYIIVNGDTVTYRDLQHCDSLRSGHIPKFLIILRQQERTKIDDQGLSFERQIDDLFHDDGGVLFCRLFDLARRKRELLERNKSVDSCEFCYQKQLESYLMDIANGWGPTSEGIVKNTERLARKLHETDPNRVG